MKNILLLTLFALLLSNCDKDNTAPKTEEEKLPAATQEGKRTFGCLIDGKAWTPKAGFVPPPISVSYNEITGECNIQAIRNIDGGLRQYLSFYSVFKSSGTLNIAANQSKWADTSSVCSVISTINPFTGIGLKKFWNTTGMLSITKVDWSTGIIAGTFEFNAYSPECADTVRITQGRFDVRYKY